MFERRIQEANQIQADLQLLLDACKKQRKKDEQRERRAGREADYTAPMGNLFGIAVWAEGFGIVGRRWNDEAGENRRWGGGTGLG